MQTFTSAAAAAEPAPLGENVAITLLRSQRRWPWDLSPCRRGRRGFLIHDSYCGGDEHGKRSDWERGARALAASGSGRGADRRLRLRGCDRLGQASLAHG